MDFRDGCNFSAHGAAAESHTNLDVELQVLVHGKYMFKYVLRYPGDDSHPFGIVKAPLPEESRRVESAQLNLTRREHRRNGSRADGLSDSKRNVFIQFISHEAQ